MKLTMNLAITARAGKEFVPFLKRHLRQARELIPSQLEEFSLALVGDAMMSRLHEQFMGVAGPTDVLSFELETDKRGRVLAGEVIVCVPEARRQARGRKIEVRHELLLYAIHGMLHFSGYDDRNEKDYRRMHRMEDKVLVQLGIGSIFEAGKLRAPRQGGSCS